MDDQSSWVWSPIARVYNPLRAGSIDGTDLDPHDRAVIRAMDAKYKPNKQVKGDPRRTLFVSNLNPKTTDDSLEKVFSKFGDIVRIRLIRDIVTGYSKRYAFIEYTDEKSMWHAHRKSYKMELEQYEIFVDVENARTLKGWVPRRLGGGLGGIKESGQLRFGGRARPFRKPITVQTEGRMKRLKEEPEDTRDPYERMREEKERRGYDRGRDKDRSREYERYRDRHGDRDRDRERTMDRDRERGMERGGYEDRVRGRDRDRDRDRERYRERERKRDRDRSEERNDRKHRNTEREAQKIQDVGDKRSPSPVT
ncbi:U11/U12 small nuclear ribonucleoprotein 35 kDa protein-like [Branchiostoma lanceolatum]|uniref:U11/U12 small nuclear ribonucleoprotein 35 kDa protein-like n=1 Tax=Branchiostoma lanceolatum TaxID=7740 RepID=UPI0034565A37